MSQPAPEPATAVAAVLTAAPGSPADQLLAAQHRMDMAAAALIAAARAYTEQVQQTTALHSTARQTWTDQQLAALGVLPTTTALATPPELGPPGTVPLGTLADFGATLNRGPDWARDDIAEALDAAGCPAVPDGPGGTAILDMAAVRLARGVATAMPDGLHLIDDLVWGPPGTDRAALAERAPSWRDHAGVGEIVAQTGLWQPPSPEVMPTVRIEGRRDEVTLDGDRLGRTATRADTRYWGVYGELPNGVADLAADFGTLDAARRYAARWNRPGTLVYADHTEPLTAAVPAPPVTSAWQSPRPAAATRINAPIVELGGRHR